MKKILLLLPLLLCSCSSNNIIDYNTFKNWTVSKIEETSVSESAKKAFTSWLEIQNLDAEPYEIITFVLTKTESNSFDYEYYVADVYYTNGDIVSKRFLFAWDGSEIIQIEEVK